MAYCTAEQAARQSGFAKMITNEAVGTGDNSETEFTLDHGKVVDGTQNVYLDGTLKTEGTDYTFNNTTGVITFGTAPGTSVAVTADYLYFPADLHVRLPAGDYYLISLFRQTGPRSSISFSRPAFGRPPRPRREHDDSLAFKNPVSSEHLIDGYSRFFLNHYFSTLSVIRDTPG